jgi:hypothetical protein
VTCLSLGCVADREAPDIQGLAEQTHSKAVAAQTESQDVPRVNIKSSHAFSSYTARDHAFPVVSVWVFVVPPVLAVMTLSAGESVGGCSKWEASMADTCVKTTVWHVEARRTDTHKG